MDTARHWDQLQNLTLKNSHVILRPISLDDREQFSKITFDPEIWRYFVTRVTTSEDLDCFMNSSVQDTLDGSRVVFAIIDCHKQEIVGSAAFGNIFESERRIEIGWSWLDTQAQGTKINRSTKFALLNYAFEHLKCERVEFKTDARNKQARRALNAIGAVEEGTLRSFNYMPDGQRRNAVYYSILRSEWPLVRSERFLPWIV